MEIIGIVSETGHITYENGAVCIYVFCYEIGLMPRHTNDGVTYKQGGVLQSKVKQNRDQELLIQEWSHTSVSKGCKNKGLLPSPDLYNGIVVTQQ